MIVKQTLQIKHLDTRLRYRLKLAFPNTLDGPDKLMVKSSKVRTITTNNKYVITEPQKSSNAKLSRGSWIKELLLSNIEKNKIAHIATNFNSRSRTLGKMIPICVSINFNRDILVF